MSFIGGEDNVYPASTAEVHYHIAALEVGETGRVTATSRKVEGDLWQHGKLCVCIKLLSNRIARTELSFTGSAGLLVAAHRGECAVPLLDSLPDFSRLHLTPPALAVRKALFVRRCLWGQYSQGGQFDCRIRLEELMLYLLRIDVNYRICLFYV